MAIPAIVNARTSIRVGDHGYSWHVIVARRYKNNLIIVSGHPLLHTKVTRKPPPSGVKEPAPNTLEYYGIVPIGEDKPSPLGIWAENSEGKAKYLPVVNWEPYGYRTLRNAARSKRMANLYRENNPCTTADWQPFSMRGALEVERTLEVERRWQKIADTWHWGIFPYWVTNSTFENTDWNKKC